MSFVVEQIVVPNESNNMALVQYSKALNLYSSDESKIAHFQVNDTYDEFEIDYDSGSGAIHIPGPFRYTHASVKHTLGDKVVAVETAIAQNATDLGIEQARAEAAELLLANAGTAEATARAAAVQTLTANLTTETSTRVSQRASADGAISSEEAARIAGKNSEM